MAYHLDLSRTVPGFFLWLEHLGDVPIGLGLEWKERGEEISMRQASGEKLVFRKVQRRPVVRRVQGRDLPTDGGEVFERAKLRV
jgi:hypothetical protein